MTWQGSTDFEIPFRTMGAKALQASTSITSSTATTAVFVGKGLFAITIDVTALSLGGAAFDTVNFLVQRNTLAATTTWQEIGMLVVGDATGLGAALGVDTYTIFVNNTGDNQVRIYAYVNGSTVSVTYSADIYPVRSKDVA